MTIQHKNIIRAENVTYKVKDKTILSDISFELSEGSFTSIVGMNGSGKTTLLKLLCNVIKPNCGQITLYDRNINSYSVKSLAQNISIVFQSNDTEFDFSAMQIVLMGRIPYQRLFDADKQDDMQICERAMRQTNTWHLKDRLINSLSGGEKQRVFIARSLAQQQQYCITDNNQPNAKSKIMLLDEPVANLDMKHQIEIMNLLKTIQKQNNTTILIVLHDLSLALKYSDNVLALKNGRIQIFDKADKVLNESNIKYLFEVSAKIAEKNNVIING